MKQVAIISIVSNIGLVKDYIRYAKHKARQKVTNSLDRFELKYEDMKPKLFLRMRRKYGTKISDLRQSPKQSKQSHDSTNWGCNKVYKVPESPPIRRIMLNPTR